MAFVHLHNHSHFSILEWLPKPKDYVLKAKELWMEAVALTDTWNLHWGHEFYKICKAEGIKPIMWVEIFVKSSLDEKLKHKLVLLAKSLKWYQNIIELLTKSNLSTSEEDDWMTLDDIREIKKKLSGQTHRSAPTENVGVNPCVHPELEIIALSWPITGEIPFYVLSWKSDEEILERIKVYQDIFGEDNFYLELLDHRDIPKQDLVTNKLIDLNKKYNIPVVACQNTYYINPEDKETQDIIQALWTGHEIENPDRPTLINGDYSFKSEEEMQMLFGFIPEALENTVKIANKCNIEFDTGWILIPVFELPEKDQIIYEKALEQEKNDNSIQKLDSSEWYLRYLSFKWLNWRYGYDLDEETIFEFIKKLPWWKLKQSLQETLPDELKELSLTYYTSKKKELLKKLPKQAQDHIERLEYELVVINEMWFNGYFLIVADYINWARDNGIPVGPWRWSAAGSLMAYLSWITDIDPVKFWLIFERFLNPARVSMPDIDTDFADADRARVIEYCRKKYWDEKVVQICTFGTFAARAAVKDVGRVMWIPFAEMNELAKLIPEKPWTKLKWALEDSIEFKEAYDTNEKYKKIIDSALKIEWNTRQLWVHACAVIIAPEPVTKFCPLQHPPKDDNVIVTQYSAYPLEDLGLLKMDFLWLRNLTIIKNTQKIIENNKWDKFDILKVPLDDAKVFEIFANGDTTWVFQFESDGMRKYLKDLSPDTFEDLIAMVSLYRPGPLAYIPTYIDRKYWREEIKYMTDDLIEILKWEWLSDEEIDKQKIKLEEDLKKILDVTYWIAVYQEQLMFIVQYMAGFSLWEADLLRRWVGKKKIEVIEALKKEFIEKWKNYRAYHPRVTQYIYEEMIQPAANYSFNKSHAACYAFIAYQTAYLKSYYRTEFLTAVMVSDEENMDRITMEVWECESHWINILPPDVWESMKHFTYIDDKNIRFWLKAIKWIWDGPIDKIIEAREPHPNPLLKGEGKKGGFKDLQDFVDKCGKEVMNKKSLEALIKAWAMDKYGQRWQLWDSIPNMIQFARRDEKQKNTNQMWLFAAMWEEYEDKLELEENYKKFSFEDKLKWEKEMIGFAVSGHALDWLKRYCERRSNKVQKLRMDFDELLELDRKENPEKYEEIEKEKIAKEMWIEKDPDKKVEKKKKVERKQSPVQAVWVITEMRSIITKTGKKMVFLKCEWFDYDFEVVIFPKDVDKYIDKLEVDKFIIVNWNLEINFEYKRKSIQARDIKIASITQVREQARDLGLMDNFKRIAWIFQAQTSPQPSPQGEGEVEKCDWSDECMINDEKQNIIHHPSGASFNTKGSNSSKEYIVKIPVSAKKQDLLILKEFLKQEKSWEIEIFIELRWQKIPTKISIENIFNLKDWEKKMWL